MRRQNFFRQIISIAIILLFLAGCNAQVNEFAPTPTVTATAKVFPTTTATMKPTDTATPNPMATEVSRFTVDKLTQIPKSIKEMVDKDMCVEIASPIDKPEQYKKDMQAYVKFIYDNVLPSYTGPVGPVVGKVGVGAEEIHLLGGTDVQPIACAKFKRGADSVFLGTLVGKDKTGLFLTNFIANPDNVDRVKGYRATPDDILSLMPGKVEGGGMKDFVFAPAQVTGDMQKFYSNQFMEDYFRDGKNVETGEAFSKFPFSGYYDRQKGETSAMLAISWWGDQK